MFGVCEEMQGSEELLDDYCHNHNERKNEERSNGSDFNSLPLAELRLLFSANFRKNTQKTGLFGTNIF